MRSLGKLTRYYFLLLTLMIWSISVSAQVRPGLELREITLDESILLARQNNLVLKMARQDSLIAVEDIRDAKTARAPWMSAGAFYNYVGNPVLYRDFYSNDSTIDYYHHQTSWNIAAGVPIYYGSKINTQIEQRQIVSKIQNEMLQMTDEQLKLNMITNFYSLYKLYREIEIIEANISSVKVSIRQIESKVKNGQNLISDLSRTQLQLSNFEIQVFNTWNKIDLLSNNICILTGLPLNLRLQPVSVEVSIPADSMLLSECLEHAYANRHELKQSLLQKNYSESNLKMSRSYRKPNISANAIYNSQLPVPGTFPPQPDILSYWLVGVGLSYDISSLYNLGHRINADKIQIEQEDVNIQQVKNDIDQDVKAAYIHFLESKTNIPSYQKNVDLAELNFRITKSRYNNEFALIIDLIDAELQVNDTKLSLNKAIVDTIIQYYSLLYSIGKLN